MRTERSTTELHPPTAGPRVAQPSSSCAAHAVIRMSSTTPTGIPSLDSLIGGGYPLGSIILIEEDVHAVYSNLLVRTFVSESLSTGRHVYASGDSLRTDCLPSRGVSESGIPAADIESATRIAWRYKSLNAVENSLTSNKHAYDFGSKLSHQIITDNRIPIQNLKALKAADIINGEVNGDNSSVVVDQMIDLKEISMSMNQLVFRFKSFTRKFPTSVVLLYWNPKQQTAKQRQEVHNMVDAVFQLEAFAKPSSAYPDFDGLFKVHKLPKINSLNVLKRVETLDLGFLMKKNNRFIEVDKLCLPPDLSETVSRTTCSSSNKSLDF